jgi:hypothetical protein
MAYVVCIGTVYCLRHGFLACLHSNLNSETQETGGPRIVKRKKGNFPGLERILQRLHDQPCHLVSGVSRKKRMMFEKSFVMKCSCGNTVRVHRHVRRRPVVNVVLCCGRRLRGTVAGYALFKHRRAQYQVQITREWVPIGHDTYTLYHVDEDVARLFTVSSSLGIPLGHAAWVVEVLNLVSSRIDSFVAFARDHWHLGLDQTMEDWKFISETEFQLLNAS